MGTAAEEGYENVGRNGGERGNESGGRNGGAAEEGGGTRAGVGTAAEERYWRGSFDGFFGRW